jgi:hypothetical protein
MTDITDAGPRLKSMNDRLEEYRVEIALLRSKLSLRDNLEAGLMAGVVRLQDEVRRLESVIAASGAGNCPDLDNGANRDNTPATHDTPSEGREQGGCTLTDEEREAVEYFAKDNWALSPVLRSLLSRLSPPAT